ncbi:MAG: DNA polymerase III subunit alpha [Proteobacteria bacterium]|nr:DNA polymerase III subunit alpha [Pseudomonadota bacterium]
MIHLHVHTYYSFHEGASSPEELFTAARERGIDTMAMTDTNGLYGLIHQRQAAQLYGIRLLIGSFLDDRTGHSAVILPRTRLGYSTLCRLITHRHMDQHFALHDALKEENLGELFVISSDLSLLSALPRGKTLFFELRPGSIDQYGAAQELGIPAVVTNGVTFAHPTGYDKHRLLRVIGLNSVFSRLSPDLHARTDQWLKAPATIEKEFAWAPEALMNSHAIVDGIEDYWDLGAWIVSRDAMEEKGDLFLLLKQKCLDGVRHRYGNMTPEIKSRLDKELDIVGRKGFAEYFLIMEDVAKQNSYTCGRGSSAASLISYLLGITQVDPIRYDLFFERFLNEDRKDPPDIDVDFPWDDRDDALKYTFEKYGRERTAMVATHVTYQTRAALREVAKVYGFAGADIGLITKKIGFSLFSGPAAPIEEQIRDNPRFRGIDIDDHWRRIICEAQSIVGYPRHISVHCGGVIIVPKGVTHYVPMELANDGRQVIQWDKDGAEEAGLVKMDILGNRSLAVIRDGLKAVKENYRILIPYSRFSPLQDPRTQEIMRAGQTMGVFYVESPAMRNLQKKAKVGDFEHLVIHSSIIRPAANRFITEYVERLHGKPYEPFHPEVRTVLNETYGIMVYQEDVSRVAMALANFTAEEADDLRKVLTKKRDWGKFAAYRKLFEERAEKRGVTQEKLDEIWEMTESFRGYSFCKPHSASFAMVSYKSAYLKAHYPAEFMAAVVSNQGGFYTTFAYLSEAKRMGIRVLLPDVNRSEFHYRAEDDQTPGSDQMPLSESPPIRPWMAIRVGFMQIKGLNKKTTQTILEERERSGPFTSLQNLLERVSIPEGDGTLLIKSGALDSLEPSLSRSQIMWTFLAHVRSHSTVVQKQGTTGHLFAFHGTDYPAPALKDYDPKTQLHHEAEVLGFLISTHPLTLYEPRLKGLHYIQAKDIKNHIGKEVTMVGWCITSRTVITSHDELMEFVSFEDTTAIFETNIFPQAFRRYAHLIDLNEPFVLRGRVEDDHGCVTLNVSHVDTRLFHKISNSKKPRSLDLNTDLEAG